MIRDTYTLVDDNGSNATLAVAQHQRWDGCRLTISYPFSRSYGFFDVLDYSATARCGLTAWGPFDSRHLSHNVVTLTRNPNLNRAAFGC